ncbi:hypothetical protein SAMN05661010_03569 [Modicisalibacter muralis]|uniref:Uncharacterized protein n=1 Tax=Modicisalibacter muralis TaxID=119000 RepID=A0A1G9R2L3_9GAMM|nr:hypothetical protein SAMN05661010_03569 [Halomonas muralis]
MPLNRSRLTADTDQLMLDGSRDVAWRGFGYWYWFIDGAPAARSR